MDQHFKAFTSNIAPFGQKISRGFGNLNQQARERFGAVDADDVTELPQEYKDLEKRVDGLKAAHANLLKIARAYESEGYDYPTQVQESVTQLTAQIGHSVTSWAASAAKNTKLGVQVQPTSAPQEVHRTLAHALSRGAASGALELGASPTNISGLPTSPSKGTGAADVQVGETETKLGEALQKLALAEDRVGNARLTQDDAIRSGFLQPWNAFGNQIQLATKARLAVRDARLHLDSWKQTQKAAEASGKAEKIASVQQEVEAAEDKLVSETETAISLMREILNSPDLIKAITAFVKAQQEYHAASAELLQTAAQDLSSLAMASESEYRSSRS